MQSLALGQYHYHATMDSEPQLPSYPEPPKVTIKFRENGPIVITGSVTVTDEAGDRIETRLFLCRCGQSKTKPTCDGSHKTCGFTAPGEPVVMKKRPG